MHRSVSQKNQHDRCPKMFELSRIAVDDEGNRLWQRPAAWLPHGTGFHSATEAWELSNRTLSVEQVQDKFGEEYARDVGKLTEETPNLSSWFGSGPWYPADKDIPRRFKKGQEQIELYIDYYRRHPHERPWRTPSGGIAVELPFSIRLGGVEVVGKIDHVLMNHLTGEIIVEDWKTGVKPGDVFQLAVYALALRRLYRVNARFGRYFMARAGSPTVLLDLSEYPEDRIREMFVKLDMEIRTGIFPARPDPDICRICSVKQACPDAAA